jgi:hypothetical protein
MCAISDHQADLRVAGGPSGLLWMWSQCKHRHEYGFWMDVNDLSAPDASIAPKGCAAFAQEDIV